MANMLNQRTMRLSLTRWAVEVTAFSIAAWVVAQSAVVAKQTKLSPPLVALTSVDSFTKKVPVIETRSIETIAATMDPVVQTPAPAVGMDLVEATPPDPSIYTPEAGYTRYYDGRPLRVKRVMWMTVTAYSPDERSCGEWADGRTATNTSVWTNAMSLVAADTRILPFGSMLSIPGYSNGEVVPVLDRGGAIKGNRLDVLYATHEIARKWGVRKVPVTVWEYADGKNDSKKKR